jgi:hypothetical protein
MKIHRMGFAAVLLLTPAMAIAVEPPNPKDLTQGKWELNVAKSKFCGAAPKKSERVIVDAGWGLIYTTWTGVDADGNPVLIHYVARYDGDKYPAGLDRPATESITWKLVSPNRLEFVHWSKDDKMTSSYVRTVSTDGQTMTQSAKFVGQACEESQVFERR